MFECSGWQPINFNNISETAYFVIKNKLSKTINISTLHKAKIVSIRGTSYAVNMFVIVGFEVGDIVFGEIYKIIFYEVDAWFLIRLYESEKLLHFGS